jgi:hypothetical protein
MKGDKHRGVWMNTYGPIPKDENGVSYEIHHIDRDPANNVLDNLMCVSIQDHYEIHLRQGDYNAAHLIAERIGIPLTGWKHLEETRVKMQKTRKGKKRGPDTEVTIQKKSISKIGNKNQIPRPVIYNPTRQYYRTVTECAKDLGTTTATVLTYSKEGKVTYL